MKAEERRDTRAKEQGEFTERKEKEKKLQSGDEITFKVIDNSTGEEIEKKGFIIGDAHDYINDHPELQAEFGNVLSGEAYIAQENPPSKRLHLITDTDIIEEKKEETMKQARKVSDSKLGFEVGKGLKRSQSKYSYEGICELYGTKKDKKEETMAKGTDKICGMDARKYITEGIGNLEKLREEIEERLEQMESIIFDFSRNVPELNMLQTRAKSYWLGSIQAMIRDASSMVTFDDTLKEIREAEDEEMEHERQVMRDKGIR